MLSQWVYAQYCHLVGRFETMHRDWSMICERLGMAIKSIPHLNPSQRGTVLEEVPEHLRPAVDMILRRDTEALGYTAPWED